MTSVAEPPADVSARLRNLATANAGLAVVATAAAVVIYVGRGHAEWLFKDWTLTNAAAALLSLLPALLARRGVQRTMTIILIVVSFAATTQVFANVVTELTLSVPRPAASEVSPATLPTAAAWATWTTFWSWLPAVGLLATSVLLRFPSGTMSGRWQRVIERVGLAGMALAMTGFAWSHFPTSTTTLDVLNSTSAREPGTALGLVLLGISAVASIVDLVRRSTRAEGVARYQFRWFAVGTIVFATVMVVSLALDPTEDVGAQAIQPASLALYTSLPALIVLLACLSVAVLRYRLYDVDVVISRSLLVAGLALFILVIYVGVVVGIGTLVTDSNEPNLALQVGATALVAVGFQPWRRRLRNWVDRVVHGHRSSPYDVLAAFSSIASQTPDESTRNTIADLLATGTGGDPAVLWLRVGDELRAVATKPESHDLAPVLVIDEKLPELPSHLAVPVEHEGELLGALTVSKSKGEQVTERDRMITERLAASVALTLRADRLTAELAEQLSELRLSRSRIVQAQDDARRRLERDLHDGAQQRLVSLKVKLGVARRQAEQAGAAGTSSLLEQIGADADDAVESLRDLARGIYPPLLEAEGLPAAIQSQGRKAPLPVLVVDRGVGRADRAVEAALYFCVLESLQNVAKYAHARSARVTLERDGDWLRFTVEDDGVGFDPGRDSEGTGVAGMRDRLDTVGGQLEIVSTPGSGTTVRGEAPARDPALVAAA